MRAVMTIAAAAVAVTAAGQAARGDWRDPIAGASVMRPARFESGTPTIHAAPRRPEPVSAIGEPALPDAPSMRWALPLTDRKLDAGQRAAPLDGRLLEAIVRIEPIYDPTMLDGPYVAPPMHISAGTAESRDVFADHWRLRAANPNIDADMKPLARVWLSSGAPRPCSAYRAERLHGWGEAALSAVTRAECDAIRRRQARADVEAAPIPVAIAAPTVPVFAAPEPGSRLSSADFWAAQRARVARIRENLHHKWTGRAGGATRLQDASN